MIRVVLLATGFIVLIVQHHFAPVSPYLQQVAFLLGIALLGIPHGAADLLVAEQNKGNNKKPFSRLYFLSVYLFRLFLFGLLLWLFPFVGILLFIVFAAYHFGETDLYFFKTDQWQGKLLVISYGLVILNVILFNNAFELNDLLVSSGTGWGKSVFINWVTHYRLAVLSFSMVFFFSCIFIYFLYTGSHQVIPDRFLLQFALLVFILYNLPLLAGFTFYFIVWHSVLSLSNIIDYLKTNEAYRYTAIVKQIILYSVLAFAGIIISGLAGYTFINRQGVIIYVFAGLAVLTAPHMQVMHDMYRFIRIKKSNKVQL